MQVTNPPIDPLREGLVMSLSMRLGARGNLLQPSSDAYRQLTLETPVLLESDLSAIQSQDLVPTKVRTNKKYENLNSGVWYGVLCISGCRILEMCSCFCQGERFVFLSICVIFNSLSAEREPWYLLYEIPGNYTQKLTVSPHSVILTIHCQFEEPQCLGETYSKRINQTRETTNSRIDNMFILIVEFKLTAGDASVLRSRQGGQPQSSTR